MDSEQFSIDYLIVTSRLKPTCSALKVVQENGYVIYNDLQLSTK